ncbi:RNA polymerase sigma factor, partial [Pseudomonas aeruginosa]
MPADGEAARRADLLKAFLAQRQRMESLVSRWVGCRATAADLVQELFLRFWRRPAAPVEELGSYLLRSARNLAIDHLRGEGSRQRHMDEWLPEQRQGEPVGPEQALEAGDPWGRVQAALTALPGAASRNFLTQ